ncbi:IclR family transcriptional regulator C-terminal domain-containing protein [Microvirga sp. VF16]|uniref:IclR family transcriptional regulator domain-containing protein n=1 Tax=Microvirga sp. VF16 TaxID=2807101 RepID=UPI00193CBAF8|nr:IclR family transcriptional regulator C-terminal domain-containing protein [Microvirga sp. VF16]QRM29232.1 helix-turn-helix domain-containing protein [Microvirga sp. VF16]
MGRRAHSKGIEQEATGGVTLDAQPDFVAGFARGLKVIRAFGENSHMLTLSQVAERSGLTVAGARRLLLTLVALGYAGTKDRFYFLTPRILSLGYSYLTSLPLYHFAQPILEELVERTGETCAVGVLDDTDVVYVLRIPVRRIASGDFGIGTRRPAHATSMGSILLGGLNERELADYFERADLRAYTGATITDPKALRQRIKDDQAQGHSWVTGEMAEHVSGLSVPIFGEDDRVNSAINISFNRPKISRSEILREYLPPLQDAADQIRRSLMLRDRSMADRPMRLKG